MFVTATKTFQRVSLEMQNERESERESKLLLTLTKKEKPNEKTTNKKTSINMVFSFILKRSLLKTHKSPKNYNRSP